MRNIKTDAELKFLEERVLHHAEKFERTLPEMRFFILDPMEFSSLLIKRVYPVAPVNIWEGKEMVNTRHRIETGQESSLYYEVVQTGRPSYAYLNETNNAMTQASVMAHVVGHCEFSELNVMHDSNDDRTEWIIYLTKKVEMSRNQMGHKNYKTFWNACESVKQLISPNSQYNLENSVDTDHIISEPEHFEPEEKSILDSIPYDSTVHDIFKNTQDAKDKLLKVEQMRHARSETLSRVGYKLKAPCQDILGFLKEHSTLSQGEKYILDYMYAVNSTQDFVVRTQIMNEGWAMYWEKKIMTELFKEKACKGIIEYSKVAAGVMYPRPYFQRNPYHLGYYMWEHIEELYKDGKVSLDYFEETSQAKKDTWKKPVKQEPLEAMGHLVRTCTDYEFLRRFLTTELVDKFHLNRIDKRQAEQLGLKAEDVIREDRRHVWIDPTPIKDEMLNFYTHLYRPRIYLIDVDYMDGGLLLFHRDDGRDLRKDWIRPTLKNINLIWKGAVSLLTKDTLFTYSAGSFNELRAAAPKFEVVVERIQNGEKPFRAK
ncbi:MAG: SpoVR family protein [Lentisphaeraceae bacterium]|nr:SpoVR family protein [Lentisphaeraceae bacterium]